MLFLCLLNSPTSILPVKHKLGPRVTLWHFVNFLAHSLHTRKFQCRIVVLGHKLKLQIAFTTIINKAKRHRIPSHFPYFSPTLLIFIKTSLNPLLIYCWKTNQRPLKDSLKKVCRPLEDHLKTTWRLLKDHLKTAWRPLEGCLKNAWRPVEVF